MIKTSRIRLSRIALIAVITSGFVMLTIASPSWPRDAWIKVTTRAIPFEFSSVGACKERNAYQPDKIWLGSDRKAIHGYVSVNCADKPGNPSITQRAGTMFLRVDSLPLDPTSDLSAACYCSNKVLFTLHEPFDPNQRVVLISDGIESARLIAP
jgi:hypothetical protein